MKRFLKCSRALVFNEIDEEEVSKVVEKISKEEVVEEGEKGFGEKESTHCGCSLSPITSASTSPICTHNPLSFIIGCGRSSTIGKKLENTKKRLIGEKGCC